MPVRVLKPTIRQSKRWNRQPYFAQVLYIRLITLADDYGRYEADPELLRSEAFPYGDPNGDPIPCQAVDGGLLSLASQDMLQIYEVGGKRYLQLTRWKERIRSDSKFPKPNDCHMSDICAQMTASPPTPTPTPTPTGGGVLSSNFGTPSNPPPPPTPSPKAAPPKFEPVARGLFRREYDALLQDAQRELQKLKDNPASYAKDLSKEAEDLIAYLASSNPPEREARIAEVKANPDSYVRTALKPAAAASVQAWKDRIQEIKRAMAGII